MFDSVISGCFAYHLGSKIYSLSPACPDFAAYENRVWEAQGRSAALNHPYTRLSFQPFQFCGCRQSCWSSQSTRLTLRGSSSTLTRASAKSSTTLRTKIPWTGFPRFYVFMLILGWFGVKGLQVNKCKLKSKYNVWFQTRIPITMSTDKLRWSGWITSVLFIYLVHCSFTTIRQAS